VSAEKEIILLAGRPDSGKSTLARSLVNSFNESIGQGAAEHLSIGDHLRLLGRGVIHSAYAADIEAHANVLNQSQRLPAEIVRNVVREYLVARDTSTRYVFVDGYPRYHDEVEPFIEVAEQASSSVASLLHLGLPYDIAKDRMIARGRREHEREVDDEFAAWRLSQHDSTYELALELIKAAGVPVHELDATLPLAQLTQQSMAVVNHS
jgi:adenylate kinase family enzyme